MNRSELYRQQLRKVTEDLRTMRVFQLTGTIRFPSETEASQKKLVFQGQTPEEALATCKQMAAHQKWEVKSDYAIEEITATARPTAVKGAAEAPAASEAVTAKATPQALATAPTQPAPPPSPATSSSSSEPHASTPASSASSATPATSVPSFGSTPATLTPEPPK